MFEKTDMFNLIQTLHNAYMYQNITLSYKYIFMYVLKINLI
jgi:hypothetical protein